jgi:serine/threonine-protein kinase
MVERQIINGRYEIIKEIGGGGMATVYLAEDHLLNRKVAIKVLRAQNTTDEKFVNDFKQEACLAARLVHPNIVNIYDVGEDSKENYIVMEYVKGQTLKKKISRDGALEPKEAIRIAIGIAEALKHAHAKGLIHCDIKPHNILLDEFENPKVTDFGISKAITTNTVKYTVSVVGSVHYLSPEQAEGKAVTIQSDLYSLGIVIFEMLTGNLPFDGDSPVAVALKHIREDAPKLSEINKKLPGKLEEIVTKALAKNLNERYKTASEMLEDLNFVENLLINGDELAQNLKLPSSKKLAREIALDLERTVILNKNDLQDSINQSKENEDTMGKKTNKLKKLAKSRNLWLSIIAILSIVLLGFILNYLQSYKTKTVIVPTVQGKYLWEARAELEDRGLNYKITEEYNANKNAGLVLSQKPIGNENVRTGRTIYLLVSKGQEVVKMPTLVGKSRESAEKILKQFNLQVGEVKLVADENLKPGIVIEQSILPNISVNVNSKINYVANMKENETIMPSVTGISLDEAKKKLEKAGLKIGKIIKVKSVMPVNTVLMSTPNAKEVIDKSKSVELSVAIDKIRKTAYMEFVVPGGKSQRVKIFSVENGVHKIIYNNIIDGGSRIRQKVEAPAGTKVQFYINDRMLEERIL